VRARVPQADPCPRSPVVGDKLRLRHLALGPYGWVVQVSVEHHDAVRQHEGRVGVAHGATRLLPQPTGKRLRDQRGGGDVHVIGTLALLPRTRALGGLRMVAVSRPQGHLTSISRSIFCASPGRRNASRNARSASSMRSPVKSNVDTKAARTAVLRACLASSGSDRNSPTAARSSPGQVRKKLAMSPGDGCGGSTPSSHT